MRLAILSLVLVTGCAAYDPAHPCLDLSTETFCDSGIVQASKGLYIPPPAPVTPPGMYTQPVVPVGSTIAPSRPVTCYPVGVSSVVCQ